MRKIITASSLIELNEIESKLTSEGYNKAETLCLNGLRNDKYIVHKWSQDEHEAVRKDIYIFIED